MKTARKCGKKEMLNLCTSYRNKKVFIFAKVLGAVLIGASTALFSPSYATPSSADLLFRDAEEHWKDYLDTLRSSSKEKATRFYRFILEELDRDNKFSYVRLGQIHKINYAISGNKSDLDQAKKHLEIANNLGSFEAKIILVRLLMKYESFCSNKENIDNFEQFLKSALEPERLPNDTHEVSEVVKTLGQLYVGVLCQNYKNIDKATSHLRPYADIGLAFAQYYMHTILRRDPLDALVDGLMADMVTRCSPETPFFSTSPDKKRFFLLASTAKYYLHSLFEFGRVHYALAKQYREYGVRQPDESHREWCNLIASRFVREYSIPALLAAAYSVNIPGRWSEEANAIIGARKLLREIFGNEPGLQDEEEARFWDKLADVSADDEKSAKELLKHESNGTGFYIHGNYILTNRHVVDRCYEIRASTLRLRDLPDAPMNVYHEKQGVDLALIRIPDEKEIRKIEARFGFGFYGDRIFLYGFPLQGLLSEVQITQGIISGDRYVHGQFPPAPGRMEPGRYMQHTAPQHGGNSGGPVIDRFGRIVGVAVGSRYGETFENIAYAIPTVDVLDFIQRAAIEFEEEELGDKVDEWRRSLLEGVEQEMIDTTSAGGEGLSGREIANQIDHSTVRITCWVRR